MIDGGAFWYLMLLQGCGAATCRWAMSCHRTFVRSRELWLGKAPAQLSEFPDSTTVAGESVDVTMA